MEDIKTPCHFFFRADIHYIPSRDGLSYHKLIRNSFQNILRRPGIEPGASRWQRDILPLNQRRCWNRFNCLFYKHKQFFIHVDMSYATYTRRSHAAMELFCYPGIFASFSSSSRQRQQFGLTRTVFRRCEVVWYRWEMLVEMTLY